MGRPPEYVKIKIGVICNLVGKHLNKYQDHYHFNALKDVLEYEIKFPIDLLQVFADILEEAEFLKDITKDKGK